MSRTPTRRLSPACLMLLQEMADRGVMGISAEGVGIVMCRALVRRGYAEPKPNMERTYRILPAGRDFLAGKKSK